MPETVTSFFTEPGDFEAKLAKEGIAHLVIAADGLFRARLTSIALLSLRLLAGEEYLSRIAFVTVPDDMVLVMMQSGTRPAPICSGIVIKAGEIITLGPGSRAYMRTDGACGWATVLVPVRDLVRLGSGLIGGSFVVPMGAERWQPPRHASGLLRRLHAAAIRTVETGHAELISREAAHGLDQQIISALIECLSAGSKPDKSTAANQCREIMIRFEALLERRGDDRSGVAKISVALGVSQRVLRRCCEAHLGLTPASYFRLRRMQEARRGSRRYVPL